MAVASAAALVGNGVRLRRRLTSLHTLDETAWAGTGARASDLREHVVVHVEGLDLRAGSLAAAVAHLEATGLEAIDLLPGDLPTEELLDHLRIADPVRLRQNPIFLAFGVGQAVVMTRELAERADIAGGAVDTVDVRRAFTQAKRYAPHGVDQVVAPGLAAVPLRADQNLAVWRTQYGRPLPIIAGARVAPAVGAAVAAAGGALAAVGVAAATALQPAIVTAGTAVRPRDRWSPWAARPASRPSPCAWRARRAVDGDPRTPPTPIRSSSTTSGPATTPPTWPAASTGSSARAATTAPCAGVPPSGSGWGPPT